MWRRFGIPGEQCCFHACCELIKCEQSVIVLDIIHTMGGFRVNSSDSGNSYNRSVSHDKCNDQFPVTNITRQALNKFPQFCRASFEVPPPFFPSIFLPGLSWLAVIVWFLGSSSSFGFSGAIPGPFIPFPWSRLTPTGWFTLIHFFV